MEKEIEMLEFVQKVNFEIIHSLKSNGTNYLVIFAISCEIICNSMFFVDFATAESHCWLSTIYIRHN